MEVRHINRSSFTTHQPKVYTPEPNCVRHSASIKPPGSSCSDQLTARFRVRIDALEPLPSDLSGTDLRSPLPPKATHSGTVADSVIPAVRRSQLAATVTVSLRSRWS